MYPQTIAPAIGDRLPDSEVYAASGAHSSIHQALGATTTIVYYMRSASCPICNAHLRRLERSATAKDFGDAGILIVVPGTSSDAASVALRHPRAPFTVVASETAHTDAALFVKVGMQQSGTFVVDATGTVRLAHVATVPTKSFDNDATVRAVASLD